MQLFFGTISFKGHAQECISQGASRSSQGTYAGPTRRIGSHWTFQTLRTMSVALVNFFHSNGQERLILTIYTSQGPNVSPALYR